MVRPAIRLIEKKLGKLTIPVLILIITLLSIPFATSLLTAKLTIRSSGTVGYNLIQPLHIDGKDIKDSLGNVVYLRGVNRGHFEDTPTGKWGGSDIFDLEVLEIELDEMKRWGINVIRVYTRVEWWINNSLANTPTGTMPHREVWKTIIQEAGKRGIYIIHTPWSLGSGGTDASMPFPPYTTRTDIIPDEDAYVDYYVSVAAELGVYPNVLYEFWNEPNSGGHPDWPYMEDWQRVTQKVIDGIRSIGDDHIIVVQYGYSTAYDPGYGPDLAWIIDYPLNDPTGNLLYSTHFYRIYDDFGVDRPYDYDTLKQRFSSENMKISWVRDVWNKPFIVGEFGAWEPEWYSGHELEAFNNTLTILNEWGISYTAWDWWTGIGFNLLTNVWRNVAPSEAGNILINRIANATS